jgi:hypothetical protein
VDDEGGHCDGLERIGVDVRVAGVGVDDDPCRAVSYGKMQSMRRGTWVWSSGWVRGKLLGMPAMRRNGAGPARVLASLIRRSLW